VGAGACAGWVWANFVRPDIARRLASEFSTSMGDRIAKTCIVPASIKPATSESAKKSRRRVTMESPAGMELADSTSAIEDSAG
jgi:hypothetical protein